MIGGQFYPAVSGQFCTAIDKSSGFTLLIDSMIVILTQHMPAKTVADIIGEHDTRIWRAPQTFILGVSCV